MGETPGTGAAGDGAWTLTPEHVSAWAGHRLDDGGD
jgi:hypothetical protein